MTQRHQTTDRISLVGLGNHRAELIATRHNAGFMLIDQLRTADWAQRPGCLQSDHAKFRLIAPNAGNLNSSGTDLSELMEPSAPMIVIIDDMDLPVGSYRYRATGSAGGHRGLQNIIDVFGYQPPRVRIGIGRPQEGQTVGEHVLGLPSDEERAQIEKAIAEASQMLCERTDLMEHARSALRRRQVDSVPQAPKVQSKKRGLVHISAERAEAYGLRYINQKFPDVALLEVNS